MSHSPRLLLCALAVACGSKDGGEVPVTQTPVIDDDTADTADTAADTGDTGDTGTTDPGPDGPFWLSMALTGGDPAQAFSGETVAVTTGTAQLSEDSTGFVLALRYDGMVDGQAFSVPCTIPFDFTGGVPSASAADGGVDVGCPLVGIGGDTFSEDLDGLTIITVNDGATVHGTFTLAARSAGHHLLTVDGEFHAEVCDGFWDGTACSW